MLFKDDAHKKYFYYYLSEFNIPESDTERTSLIYALTITEDCRKHMDDCFDPIEGIVRIDALHHGWVTGSDARAIRLAFNLFNGGVPTSLQPAAGNNLYDKHGDFVCNRDELLASTVSEIFSDGCLCRYFMQAIQLRYPRNFR